MKKILFFVMVASLFASCSSQWPYGWEVPVAECVNKSAVDAHVAAYPERWKAAFEYLKETDLSSLEIGEYEILGRDVYATVSSYEPKEPENCRFEAHRKYVDIQYLISGTEMMGVTPLEGLEETVPYTEDIAFYGTESADAVYETATPEKFFVFFPEDAHRPSMKTDGSETVRKIVIKLLY